MNYTIGLDLGTSSVKGVLLSANDTVAAEQSVKMHYRTNAGYIGFDADRFCADVFTLVAALAAQMPEGGRITSLAAVCASGNTLLCDENCCPLLDAVSWTNEEMKQEVEAVFGGSGINLSDDAVRARSGWGFLYTFSLAHLAYLKVHHPAEFSRAAHVAMAGEYLLYRLTGKWGIDRSTATPFYLADQVAGCWYSPYLDALGLREAQLPSLGQSGDTLGCLTPEAAARCGLSTDTTVRLGSFDHPGGAIAGGVIEEGDLLVSCGTSWVCLFPVRDRTVCLREKLLCDPFLSPEGCFAGMFSLVKIGETLDAAIRLYAGEDDDRFDRFYAMAEAAGLGADGLRLDPMNDPLPLPNGNVEALARAVVEWIASALRGSMRQIEAYGITFRRAVMAGGPSRNPICRAIVEEIIGVPVDYRFGVSSGAVGAAMIARGDLARLRAP